MSDYWTYSRDAGFLTMEALERAFEQIKNAPTDPCRLGRHVVFPRALREGWTYARCANCGQVVQMAGAGE